MHKKSFFVIILLLIALILFSYPVAAQDGSDGPVYVIQPGDTLNSIAERFGISVNDLININNLTDPNLISQGISLIIPGLQEISGELTTINFPFGESFRSLAKRYQVPEEFLNKINRITSPSEIYAGSSIIMLMSDNVLKLNSSYQVNKSTSSLEAAMYLDKNPWNLILVNNWNGSEEIIKGDYFYYSNQNNKDVFSPISPFINKVDFLPLPLRQGSTATIKIKTNEPLEITGILGTYPLHFYENSENEYSALQGMHAMSQPGLVSLRLYYKNSSGVSGSFEQSILLNSGNFGQDPPLYVLNETIDPAITKPEEDQILAIVSNNTQKQLWDGKWLPPTADYDCIKSRFGNRRSYNGSDYTYFHTGVDYGVCVTPSLAIYAPANGTVVFAGPLTVRGNMTIIDHGQGVFSAYFHQAEIKVNVGDSIVAGQEIGTIGATGRVTGPHLHWEIWVNGVQVQPLDWLENQFP